MDTAVRVEVTYGRAPLSALAKWTVATRLAGVALLVYRQIFQVRGFMPPIALLFGVPALIFAALAAGIRRCWARCTGFFFWPRSPPSRCASAFSAPLTA